MGPPRVSRDRSLAAIVSGLPAAIVVATNRPTPWSISRVGHGSSAPTGPAEQNTSCTPPGTLTVTLAVTTRGNWVPVTFQYNSS